MSDYSPGVDLLRAVNDAIKEYEDEIVIKDMAIDSLREMLIDREYEIKSLNDRMYSLVINARRSAGRT